METKTLDFDSPSIKYLCQQDEKLSKVIKAIGPLTYRVHTDPYAFLVHEIIEQMLSVKAGNKIYGRLVDLCGGKVTPESICGLTDEEIRSCGTSRSKVSYIRSLTEAVTTGVINWRELADLADSAAIKKLTKIRGIGNWSAKMFLIFCLDRQDVLPTEDVAFLQAYEWLYEMPDRKKAIEDAKKRPWSPYSSIAARYLYEALDSGLTNNCSLKP